MRDSERKRLIRSSEALVDAKVTKTEFPGGKSRRSCRIYLEDGRTAIATRRENAHRAMLEARVMRALGERGTAVPRVIGFNGMVLVQEDVGDLRLSKVLDSATEAEVGEILEETLGSLASIHLAAHSIGLEENVPSIGKKQGWLMELLARPAVVGEGLDVPAPDLDVAALLDQLAVRQPAQFVKWDARPGNALVRDDGAVVWFDWEHCGRRNGIDDMAWLLGDEFVPDLPEVVDRLLDRYLESFAVGAAFEDPRAYFTTYAIFHSCVRLELILEYKEDGDWWDWNRCIEGDKAGIALMGVRRLCERAGRWAAESPYTKPLVPWFETVLEKLVAEGPCQTK